MARVDYRLTVWILLFLNVITQIIAFQALDSIKRDQNRRSEADSDCYGFRCDSGDCIPEYWTCDYNPDCPDHSDEDGCEFEAPECDGFLCDTNNCIPNEQRCDHYDDCWDHTDEQDCLNVLDCLADEWRCDNGFCIKEEFRCDRDNDCYDYSDEDGCQ